MSRREAARAQAGFPEAHPPASRGSSFLYGYRRGAAGHGHWADATCCSRAPPPTSEDWQMPALPFRTHTSVRTRQDFDDLFGRLNLRAYTRCRGVSAFDRAFEQAHGGCLNPPAGAVAHHGPACRQDLTARAEILDMATRPVSQRSRNATTQQKTRSVRQVGLKRLAGPALTAVSAGARLSFCGNVVRAEHGIGDPWRLTHRHGYVLQRTSTLFSGSTFSPARSRLSRNAILAGAS